MSASNKGIIVNLNFKGTGGALPSDQPEHPVDKAAYAVDIAKRAEAQKIHAIFRADSLAISSENLTTVSPNHFEPISLFSYLAAKTSRIGFVVTQSTSFADPYNVARQLASLDHLSNGRLAWNIVTSALKGVEQNFSRDEPIPHDERYAIAEEFVEVATQLWSSWDRDALYVERTGALAVKPGSIHAIEHRGKYFTVKGPLNITPSPQGRPVFVQAGSSGAGLAFAGQWADAVYSVNNTIEEARAYADDLRSRVVNAGRPANALKILQGVRTVIAPTESEARERWDQLQSLEDIEATREYLTRLFGVDLRGYDLDGPVPELPSVGQSNSYQTQYAMFHRLLAEERPATLRAAILAWGGRLAGRSGGPSVVGTPAQVADVIQQWYESGAVDGFNISGLIAQGGAEAIVDTLVPELRRRGLFRDEYEGHTLRENYGLPA